MHYMAQQRGQILPLALAGVVLAAAIFVLLSNVGNRVTEKSVVVNAADAAAYSGAVWVARHLNFMAYTNRAMIANHVGVGHFVAYMSWIRYVEDVTDNLEDIAQFIPFVNAAARAAEQSARFQRQLAELQGNIYVPAVDTLNQFYHSAQLEAHATLATDRLDQLMQTTADRFDPTIRINDPGALGVLDASLATPIQAALAVQDLAIPAFIAPFQVTDRSGELVRLVENTYGARSGMSKEWLTDRGWKINLFLVEIEKEYETEHTLTDDLADWETYDRLVQRDIIPGIFGGTDETTLGEGEASAREFSEDYRGIPGYYNLTNPTPGHYALPIVAYASKAQAQVASHDVFGMEPNDLPLSGLAIAQVEHRRPQRDFPSLRFVFDGADEYANIYNPFWQARLVGVDTLDLGEALLGIGL